MPHSTDKGRGAARRGLTIAVVGAAAIGFALTGAPAQDQPAPDTERAGNPAIGLEQQPAGGMDLQGRSALGPGTPGVPSGDAGATPTYAGGGGTARDLLSTPVTTLYPGNVAIDPKVKNPVGDDPAAVERGKTYFESFNCVGCHAANGAGGMGPALSNAAFIYGSEPANIYLTIYQGRPRGMPAWGAMLPDNVIWDLVSYVTSLSRNQQTQWGTTVSATSPSIEQVPAEYLSTTEPWQHTEPFSNGQKPNQAK